MFLSTMQTVLFTYCRYTYQQGSKLLQTEKKRELKVPVFLKGQTYGQVDKGSTNSSVRCIYSVIVIFPQSYCLQSDLDTRC